MLNPARLVFTVIVLVIGSILGCNRKADNTERKQLFDFNWEFHQGDISSVSSVDFNDLKWRDLDLPHEWTFDGRLAQSRSREKTELIPEVAWYRKRFRIPADWQRKRVSIYFEGVAMNPEVFINGSSLGLQTNGSSSYYHDITPFLNLKKDNIIVVRVNGTGPAVPVDRQRVGIYSHVWLILKDTL